MQSQKSYATTIIERLRTFLQRFLFVQFLVFLSIAIGIIEPVSSLFGLPSCVSRLIIVGATILGGVIVLGLGLRSPESARYHVRDRRFTIGLVLATAVVTSWLAYKACRPGNFCPDVSLEVSPSRILPGSTSYLHAIADDFENDPLDFTWSANQLGLQLTGGPFEEPNNTYTAPVDLAGNTVQINVQVNDRACGIPVDVSGTVFILRAPDTHTPTPSPTNTPPSTATITATTTPTWTPTHTPSPTRTPSPTYTPTTRPTHTPSPTSPPSPFYIYTDWGSDKNHFEPTFMGDTGDITIFDARYTEEKCSGTTAVHAFYAAQGTPPSYRCGGYEPPCFWAGVFWQNGWGELPDAGVNLSQYNVLVFCAKGKAGGEKIEFGMGGLGYERGTGKPIAPYPDSTRKAAKVIILTSNWEEYTIPLTGSTLTYIAGGFFWSASRDNNPAGATFYIDEIRYEYRNP